MGNEPVSSNGRQPNEPVALLTRINKTYLLDSVEVPVVRNLDLLVRPNRFTVLYGPSGSGKTTILNMIGCIDRPDSGEVMVAGKDVGSMTDDQLSDFRIRHIGFVFQNYNLVPVLNAYENIEYPMAIAGMSARVRGERVPKLLAAVGLSDHERKLPGQLSGGQRQRVAIARALAMRPRLVIADEPTANLDSKTGEAILSLMRAIQRRYLTSFIFSSHDRQLIRAADDAIYLRDGAIVSIRRRDDDLNANGGDPS